MDASISSGARPCWRKCRGEEEETALLMESLCILFKRKKCTKGNIQGVQGGDWDTDPHRQDLLMCLYRKRRSGGPLSDRNSKNIHNSSFPTESKEPSPEPNWRL